MGRWGCRRGHRLALQIGEQRYPKGLGLHANGEIVVDLGGAFTKFEAEVGVQAQGGSARSVVFEIFADDKSLWKSAVMRPADAAVKVSVAIGGRSELRLVATDAAAVRSWRWQDREGTRASRLDEFPRPPSDERKS
jgi:hypothetical protein